MVKRMLALVIMSLFAWALPGLAADAPVQQPLKSPMKLPAKPAVQQPGKPAPPPQQGTLSFVHPRQGDHYSIGMQMLIEWAKQGTINDPCYTLSLYQGDSLIRPIAQRVCVNGYQWAIPADLPTGSYRVLLSTSDGTVRAFSTTFPVMSQKANVGIRDFSIQPDPPGTNDLRSAVVKVKFQNSGQAKSVPHEFLIKFRSESTGREMLVFFPMKAMAFGDHESHSKKITFDSGGKWTYTLSVSPLHSDELISWGTPQQGEYIAGYYPDLVVCIYEFVDVKPLQHAYIWVDVRNRGAAQSEPSELEFWIEGKGTKKFTIPPLRPNPKSPWTLYRYELWGTVGESNYRVTVNSDKRITESSYANNQLSGTIYHYYTVNHEEKKTYRCGGNCELNECRQ